ncbi:sensor histidine kinase [Pseudomonas baetica]|uniref:sensor histidine kinase n=1 Tax=Pseudomonas baetica TaxID=674054 RepID=UPI002406B80E|nr:histidine kinase [Pseudomonas baetica]MDF9774593.1 signal transduction histidine kinase [Pseudomonas baetica]
MCTETKAQPNSETLVNESDQTLVESDAGQTSSDAVPGRQITGTKLRHLSRSTQFVICATIILGLTMTLVGNLVSQSIEEATVQTAAETGARYMQNFLEPFVQGLTTAKELPDGTIQTIDQLLSSTSLSTHVVSVKIWLPDGTIVYSTDKSAVQKKFPTEEISQALTGKIYTELDNDLEDDTDDAFERSLNIPFYEIFAPLREAGTGKIVAVGEFYETAQALQREINNVREKVWAIVGTATMAMLLLLFFIVRRDEKIIKQQMDEQARLHSNNAALQHKVTTANREFSRINELTLRRIGADLHDGPAQLLSLILLRLEELEDSQGAPDGEVLEMIRRAGEDALNEVREISLGLALPEVTDLTLHDALVLLAERHEERTETRVDLKLDTLPDDVPIAHKICIYRFAQEALNNAYIHAGGKGQKLSASHSEGLLEVQVEDAGLGISTEKPSVPGRGRIHLGLVGMRYRVESLGGIFSIESTPHAGTKARAQFKI